MKTSDRKSFLKVGKETINNYIDKETGEILDMKVSQTTFLVNTKEEFYLMYSSMLTVLKMSKDIRMKMYAALISRYAKGQEFSMTRHLKDTIAKEANCASRSLDVAFKFLIDNNLVVKLGPRTYKINPRYVFKGSSNTRNKELKAIIELHCKDC